MARITICLWFDGQAEEAANFYVGIFPNSRIIAIARYTEVGPGKPGSVMTATFELDGQKMMGLNGGPEFPFTEAISMAVVCKDQQEIDYFWEKLTADGGKEVECGWLKDKYGVSWQVYPAVLEEMEADPDRERASRVMKAMLKMKKIELAKLEAAYRGETGG
jgi:predicted 3-demethylubiquinone-9 3-methyltransferase (glyoxalase superfamily)